MKFVSMLLVVLCSIGMITFSNQPTTEERVTFRIKKGFSTIKGEFSKVDYCIALDQSGAGTIYGTVTISSVSTGNATRDKHLQNQEWLDAATYPKIRLQARKIVKNKASMYTGTFEVTIKGKTEIQEIPFQILQDGDVKTLKATFYLSTATFGIGGELLIY